MSARYVGSSKKSKSRDASVKRPFDPAIERRARQIAQQYRVILEPDAEVGFVGRGLEMPTVFADGRTPNECLRATGEALSAAVATMLEMGLRPPAPSAKGTRQAQINVRLTAEEKLFLEESARRAGFRGLSDFVRAAALTHAGGPVTAKKKTKRRTKKRATRPSRQLA